MLVPSNINVPPEKDEQMKSSILLFANFQAHAVSMRDFAKLQWELASVLLTSSR